MKRLHRFLRNTLFLLFLFCLIFPSFPRALSAAQTEYTKIVRASDTVEHIFTHCLIAHPEIAFRKNNEYGKHLDKDCLTAKEFEKILYALYENNYALVDIRDTFSGEGLQTKRIDFPFPKDKKPLVLSFDDVVYAQKNQGKGMCDKLVLTDSGKIAAYTKNAETPLHGKECIPVVEAFIEKHPDFSYRGARGILFLTGFDGVLGYRTQRDSSIRQSEIKKVKPLIAALKEKGWLFGSHSYAHGHIKKYTAEQMRSDTEKWKNEVEPLVGKTALFAYPYGEWAIGENCSDERAQILLQAGFSLFCGVGSNPYYQKTPLSSEKRLLLQDRTPLDGYSLRAKKCERFFSCKEIYDDVRPIPFPN